MTHFFGEGEDTPQMENLFAGSGFRPLAGELQN